MVVSLECQVIVSAMEIHKQIIDCFSSISLTIILYQPIDKGRFGKLKDKIFTRLVLLSTRTVTKK